MISKNYGFTIVEVLVVVVVISMLATIAIVSYRGIQDRSKNIQLLTAFDQYEKVLNLYYLEHGAYPADAVVASTAPVVCLGSGYTETALFGEGVCRVFDTRQDSVNSAVDAALAGELTAKPMVHSGTLYNGPNPSGGSVRVRGLAYTWHDIDGARAAGYTMFYYVSGDQACGRGSKFTVSAYGQVVTQCAIRFYGDQRVAVDGML